MSKKKLFLLDGSAIFYRSYFAFIRNPLINSKGENTSATFGFLNTLFKIIEDEHPDYLAIIFDTKEPTFRHKMYPEYKVTREKMPQEMAETYPRLIQTLQTLNINLFDLAGYEADDLIATFAKNFSSDNVQVYIVSGDKDLAQLVNENVFLFSAARKAGESNEILDREGVKSKYGIYPERIKDWLALMGDKSDNVPGVPSVGEKTALNLLEEYSSLEDIYKRIESVQRDKLRDALKNNKDNAYLSYDLVCLDEQVPVETDLENLKLKLWDSINLNSILQEMEFNRLVAKAESIRNLIAGDNGIEKQMSNDSDTSYHLVETEEQFKQLLEIIKNAKEFAFDLETDSLDTFTAVIAGIALSFTEKCAYYISINHQDSRLSQDEVLSKLKPFFADEKVSKIGQNTKFDTMILRQNGTPVKNLFFDTMIASYLIDASAGHHNLNDLAQKYLNHQMIPIEDIIGSGKTEKKMTELSANFVCNYACEDADITLRLKHILEKKLNALEMEELFHQIEMPLVEVLIEMEEQGVTLDTKLLAQLERKLDSEIVKLRSHIFTLAGEEFNINSPQQLGTILFDKLEIQKDLNIRKPKRTKTGQYATSEQILERYSRHPLPDTLLEYRHLNKLLNTYITALPKLIHPKTGKVHTSFNQTIAATGRLSSINPNLQNIPIRTKIGREMRKAFIPSTKNTVILSADYSQIELRIMAHLSGDTKMQESFKNDQDIHVTTAAQIFNIPLEEVDSEQRRRAKAINFGIIYGMSKYGLSNRLAIPVEEAETFIFDYFATYPNIQDFMRHTIAFARENGYVKTMLGRRRYLPQIAAGNRQIREFAERTSINTPIQGSAADLIKKAMIDIHHAITKRALSCKMILQVHDELVFEVPEKELDDVSSLVKVKMEQALSLSIPLKVDIGIGANWLEAH
jgi:DNA polymerase-1